MRDETKSAIFLYAILTGVPVLIGISCFGCVGGWLGAVIFLVIVGLWITSGVVTRGGSIMEDGIVLIVVAMVIGIFISSYRNANEIRQRVLDKAATRHASSQP